MFLKLSELNIHLNHSVVSYSVKISENADLIRCSHFLVATAVVCRAASRKTLSATVGER